MCQVAERSRRCERDHEYPSCEVKAVAYLHIYRAGRIREAAGPTGDDRHGLAEHETGRAWAGRTKDVMVKRAEQLVAVRGRDRRREPTKEASRDLGRGVSKMGAVTGTLDVEGKGEVH